MRNTLFAFFSPVGRHYGDEANNIMPSLLGYVFSTGIIGLVMVYTVNALYHPDAVMSFSPFLWIMVTVIGIDIIRFFLIQYIRFTFDIRMPMQVLVSQYLNLRFWAGIVLFVYMLLLPMCSHAVIIVVPICLTVLYCGIILWKLSTAFGVAHIGYSALYFIHLELVPIAGLIAVARTLIV